MFALFFFRYWSVTRDRLCAMFAAAFLTFAVSRGILTLLEEAAEGRVSLYALRLLAFALILAAIIDKNRSRPAHPLAHSHNAAAHRARQDKQAQPRARCSQRPRLRATRKAAAWVTGATRPDTGATSSATTCSARPPPAWRTTRTVP